MAGSSDRPSPRTLRVLLMALLGFAVVVVVAMHLLFAFKSSFSGSI